MTGEFGLTFGAISEPIADQLSAAGLEPVTPLAVKGWQHRADCITDLHIGQILTDSAAVAARRKLIKQISRGIRRTTAAASGTEAR